MADITINIRFRGGKCKTMTIPAPIRECDRLRTSPDIVAQIDKLLSERTDGEIASILNEQGLKTGAGDPFTATSVRWIKTSKHLKSLRHRLREKGMLTSGEMAKQLGLTRNPVMRLLKLGQL